MPRPFIVKKYSQARHAWPVFDRESGQEIGQVSTAGPRRPYEATTPAGISRTEHARVMACYWLLARHQLEQQS